MQCPSDSRKDRDPYYRTFAMSRLSYWPEPGIAWYPGISPVKMGVVVNPSMKVLLSPWITDGNQVTTINYGYCDGPIYAPIGDHGTSGNLLFAAGNVTYMRMMEEDLSWWINK